MEYRVVRSDDHLAHYGVLGMKWGVRRYQKKDGTLTKKGQKHYGNAETSKQKAKPVDSNESSGGLKMKWESLTKKQKRLVIIGAVAVASMFNSQNNYY